MSDDKLYLQATIDAPDFATADKLLEIYQTIPEIDCIEMGAPMVSHYGVLGAEWFLERIEPKGLYVDTKMIDFPHLELTPFIEAGARHFSAMCVMNDGAFEELSKLMEKHELWVFISMMGYPLDAVGDRCADLITMGFRHFIAHGAGVTPEDAFEDLILYLDELQDVREAGGIVKLIAAGGITAESAPRLSAYPLEGLIVGRGIARAEDPRAAAQSILAGAQSPVRQTTGASFG